MSNVASRAILGIALLAAGCADRGELLGTFGGAPDGALPDGGAPQGMRFSTPELVAPLADPSAEDSDPTFTADLTELFFTSTRGGNGDIWTSRRMAASDPWGAPTLVTELASPTALDYGPAVSADGLRIWFTTDRDTTQGRIWQSSRTSRTAPWTAPRPVSELASPSVDFSPTVDATETTMMFGSNRFGGMRFDIYVSTRFSPNSPWGIPHPVPGVNSMAFDDWDPFVAQGGLIIFFTSMRQGMGDIFWSVRQSLNEPFPAPLPLSDVNSASYDSDPSLSVDLSYLMFDSNRTGNSEIYEAHALR